MNNEYIRRDDAVEALKAQADTMRTRVERYAEQRRGILTAVNIVEDVEPADVVPVVHGRWIKEWWHGETARKCSVCNITQTVNVYNGKVKFKYCPYCGAKMDAR